MEYTYQNINNQNLPSTQRNTYAIFVDLRKAFDTVCHEILIRKLYTTGLDEHTVAWFRDYLADRSQRTRVNNNISSTHKITYGVPQGSVLGPPLFSIYINDLAPRIKHSQLIVYADDTLLMNNNPKELQQDLKILEKWAHENMLTINTDKTKWMSLGPNKIDPSVNFSMAGTKLIRTEKLRYLGVILDQKLKFDKHRSQVHSSTNLRVYELAKVRKQLSTKAALMVYKATVLPVFDNADTFYDQNTTRASTTLQLIQNRALRVVYKVPLQKNPSHTTDELHAKAKLLKLEDRRTLHMVQEAARQIKKGKYKHPITKRTPTRAQKTPRMYPPKINHPLFHSSPAIKLSVAWNKLPDEIKNKLQSTEINSILKLHFLDTYMPPHPPKEKVKKTKQTTT
jgi:hypothetical protein